MGMTLKFKCVGITEGTHDEAKKDDKGKVLYKEDGTTPQVISVPALGATLQLLQPEAEHSGVSFAKKLALGQLAVNRMSDQQFDVGQTYEVTIEKA